MQLGQVFMPQHIRKRFYLDADNKYLLAITCYNCAPQITRVLDKIDSELEDRLAEIMVINNRSTDDLEKVVQDYIKRNRLKKIRLFRNDENYSLGGSHKVAFLHGKEIGATHVIILHGDDQADARDIPGMLKIIEENEGNGSNTVLGSRFNADSILNGYDKKRIIGNRVLNRAYSIITQNHVEDLGSGLNIFALNDLDESRYLNYADRLTFNFEMLLDLIDRNVPFSYFPIHWSEDDQVSNARNFNIAWTAFKNVMSWRFDRKNFFGGEKRANDYTTHEVNE